MGRLNTLTLNSILHIYASIMLASGFAGAARTPTATTECGDLLGAPIENAAGSVDVFRSIRYASPPTRFASPAPAVCWNGTYDATSFKSVCTQLILGSEDCLFLDV